MLNDARHFDCVLRPFSHCPTPTSHVHTMCLRPARTSRVYTLFPKRSQCCLLVGQKVGYISPKNGPKLAKNGKNTPLVAHLGLVSSISARWVSIPSAVGTFYLLGSQESMAPPGGRKQGRQKLKWVEFGASLMHDRPRFTMLYPVHTWMLG